MTEDKIREALFAIADRAPHPVRVSAGLADRRRAHRQRRALLLAGAAGAVAVTAGGAAALTRLRSTGPDTGIVPPGGATPSPSASPTPPPGTLLTPSPEPSPRGGNTFVPMKYRPTWLPEGLGEIERSVTVSGGDPYDQRRAWQAGASGTNVYLDTASTKRQSVKGWKPATVQGHRGWTKTDESMNYRGASVIWQDDVGVWFSVLLNAGPDDDASEVAMTIAESVVPDGVTGCEVFLSFGWLPEGLRGGAQRLGYSTGFGAWSADFWTGGHDGMDVGVWIGPEVDLQAPSDPVTVRGRRGKKVWFTYPSGGKNDGGKVFVDLGPVGLSLSSFSKNPVSLDDLVRIADDMRIGPDPYLGWSGQR